MGGFTIKTFNWDKFEIWDIAVHCATEDEANEFLKQAHGIGFTWSEEESLLEKNYYSNYKNGTCYRAWCDYNVKELAYQKMSYYQRNDYTILEWSDYMEFTKENLKVGMLVETDIGVAIVMSYADGNVLEYHHSGYSILDSFNFSNVIAVWGLANMPNLTMYFGKSCRPLLYERKATKEMTVEEISKALGYDVKIVKG